MKLVSMSGVRSGWSVNSIGRTVAGRRLGPSPSSSSSDRPSQDGEGPAPDPPTSRQSDSWAAEEAEQTPSQPSRCSQQLLLLLQLLRLTLQGETESHFSTCSRIPSSLNRK